MRASVSLVCALGCLAGALALAACGGSTTTPVGGGGGNPDSGARKDGSSTTSSSGSTGNKTQDSGGGMTGTDSGGNGQRDAPQGVDAPMKMRKDGGMGAKGCPAAAPTAGSACTTVEECTYGDNVCDCSIMRTWGCHTCPTAKPTVGSACTAATGGGAMGGAATCDYGATDCTCTDEKWACDTCPAAAPTDGTACTVAGEACTYDGGACRCTRAVGMGMMGGDEWRCGGMMMMGGGTTCPTTQPATGAACTGEGTCPFTADGGRVTMCACVDDKFACN